MTIKQNKDAPAARGLEGVRKLPDAVHGRQIQVHDGVRGRVHVHVLRGPLGLGKVAARHDHMVAGAGEGIAASSPSPELRGPRGCRQPMCSRASG